MRRGTRRAPAALIGLLLALTAAGCIGRPASSESTAPERAGVAPADVAGPAALPDVPGPVEPTSTSAPGSWSMAILEPSSLLPGAVEDTAGRQVAAALFTTLVQLDPETAEPVEAVAESISTEDATAFTITIAEGWTFHDGIPITAATFVDTFNVVTDPTHGLPGAAQYVDVVGAGPDGRHDGDGLGGVALIDERTFVVTLQRPRAGWPARLAHPAFAPLHPACHVAPTDCESALVGNGPYRMDGRWEPGVRVAVSRWEQHPLHDPQMAGSIEFRIYRDSDTAVLELEAGLVDVVSGVPGAEVARLAELFDGGVVRRGGATVELLVLPMHDEAYGEPADLPLRQALSLAIDRRGIAEQVVPRWDPADSLVPVGLPGRAARSCRVCRHDPIRARQLWDAHGGLPELVLWVNDDEEHSGWAEAVAQAWRTTFEVPVEVHTQAFATHAADLAALRTTGPARLGWTAEPPDAVSALAPLSADYADFDDPAVHEALQAAAMATDPASANRATRRAERAVLEALPVIPLFQHTTAAVHGPRVEGVTLDVGGLVRAASVRITD